MSKTRVLLIGAGAMANSVHYPSLAEMDDIEIVALCDMMEEKLNKTADRFHIAKRYTNARDMMEKETADAIYILMPPHHLFDLVIAALRKKLNVFVEKPPALTSFQVRSFVREAEKNGVLGMVGFNRRYIPMLTYAKKAVESTAPITQVSATFYKHASAVYYDGAIDVIGCDAIHAVDSLRWMAGDADVAEVHSVPARHADVVDNAWNAVVRFANDVTGILLTNWNTGGRLHTFEMHAPGASAFLNPDNDGRIVRDANVETLETKALSGSDQNYKYYGFFQQARHFIDCVREHKTPSSSFQDAVKTMELMERIRTGR